MGRSACIALLVMVHGEQNTRKASGMFSDRGQALDNVFAVWGRDLKTASIRKRISLSSGVKANRNKQR